VVGTRPQIIKSAPIVQAAKAHSNLEISIIHTGQHYDYELSRAFFSEFKLPAPIANLRVGSEHPAIQVAKTMARLEPVFLRTGPDIVLVPGDTNSALAAGLAANKCNIQLAHVEAGARCNDLTMPEEVNRRILDHIGSTLFTPTETCNKNLRREGIARDRVVSAGDTMYDLFSRCRAQIMVNDIDARLGLSHKGYALLTVHRQGTIENRKVILGILKAVLRLRELQFVLPIHPHTRSRLAAFGFYRKLTRAANVKLINPIGYFETIKLASSARLVATDSGGLQKEAFWVGTPCITLRDSTEWVETIRRGANFLAGTDEKQILATIRKVLAKPRRIREAPNPFGDGRASERIVATLVT
jgi:UDP-N-acetylglucosamine 2-epimerase (non-hydrolysing)